MIGVDAPALTAILDEEADAARYAEAGTPMIPADTFVETGIVMPDRLGPKGPRKISNLIQEASFQVGSFAPRHAQPAIEAYAAFGKGRKGAGPNYADCFWCALAKATGLPLLFKGRDFLKTYISSALRYRPAGSPQEAGHAEDGNTRRVPLK